MSKHAHSLSERDIDRIVERIATLSITVDDDKFSSQLLPVLDGFELTDHHLDILDSSVDIRINGVAKNVREARIKEAQEAEERRRIARHHWKTQRPYDASEVLEYAVCRDGVDSIDDLYAWLDLPRHVSMDACIDEMARRLPQVRVEASLAL